MASALSPRLMGTLAGNLFGPVILALFPALTACAPASTQALPIMKVTAVTPAGGHSGPAGPWSATTPVITDDNRMLVELAFTRPDGGVRNALTFVNMGSVAPALSAALANELQVNRGDPLNFSVGGMTMRVEASAVDQNLAKDFFQKYFAPNRVEAILPAGILQNYLVVLDYGKGTLTLALPGKTKPDGIAVPAQVNQNTGLISVEALVDGHVHPVAIDNGTGYTLFRGQVVQAWLRTHPDWQRGVGAVGESNTGMLNNAIENEGTVVRVPEIALGPLRMQDVGVLGTGSLLGSVGDGTFGDPFWNSFSKRTPVAVDGLIGGNVLKGFRLTIDYQNRMTYWQKARDLDPHDLDQVGITLERRAEGYFIAGIARQAGKATVEGIAPGDKLVQIDVLPTENATRGAVLAALHGTPGDRRVLTIERAGQQLQVTVPVTEF
jgi:hypothetical protein